MIEQNGYIWQETEKDEIRLLRVFGNVPVIYVPEKIEGKTVTEIGAYCFAEKAHWKKEKNYNKKNVQNKLELSGKEVEQIVLPDTVRKIGRCAFYNCTQLSSLKIGQNAVEFESDVFLNCKNLHQVCVHGSIHEKSGIRQMLTQVTWDIFIQFEPSEKVETVVFYPEYREYYDEIGPAHIFCMNIEGEGFRLRKAFQEEKVDFTTYDAAFLKASARESKETLQTLALVRLMYPVELTQKSKEMYETYLQAHQEELPFRLLKEKKLEAILFLLEHRLCKDDIRIKLIMEAVSQGWTKGAAALMKRKQQVSQADRYRF